MGSKCYTSKRTPHFQNVEDEPPDTEQFNRQGLPALDFELELSDIEIRGLPTEMSTHINYKSVCLQLLVDEAL